jgi:hypothetical protein
MLKATSLRFLILGVCAVIVPSCKGQLFSLDMDMAKAMVKSNCMLQRI